MFNNRQYIAKIASIATNISHSTAESTIDREKGKVVTADTTSYTFKVVSMQMKNDLPRPGWIASTDALMSSDGLTEGSCVEAIARLKFQQHCNDRPCIDKIQSLTSRYGVFGLLVEVLIRRRPSIIRMWAL